MKLDSEKKILPLCSKHVIAMSLFKDLNVILVLERILLEVRPFFVALPCFADSCSKPTWREVLK